MSIEQLARWKKLLDQPLGGIKVIKSTWNAQKDPFMNVALVDGEKNMYIPNFC